MALSDEDLKRIDCWFTPNTREEEAAWIDRLVEVSALYTERGFTRGEGAILFMLGNILNQTASIQNMLKRWDEGE